MIVEIKKTKITKSMLGQMQRATPKELRSFRVIGWCVNKRRHIILYDIKTHKIRRFPFFTSTEKVNGGHDNFNVIVKIPNVSSLEYKCKSETEAFNFMGVLDIVKSSAEEKGQFFI